jgi:drug/metabolite transporter (DMT)-like permease
VLSKQDHLMTPGLGIVDYYVASLLNFEGLQYIPASFERLVLFLYPTFVMLFSAGIQRHTITRHQAIALALSYVQE